MRGCTASRASCSPNALIELELELIQYHMAQKPLLRGEVGARLRVIRACGQRRERRHGRARWCKCDSTFRHFDLFHAKSRDTGHGAQARSWRANRDVDVRRGFLGFCLKVNLLALL